ncbi:MAG: PAS domain S-box protein [Dehalococcoidia bacterium]|nr:PAS domain S-box protein [Dehalococcoidia bacterium]
MADINRIIGPVEEDPPSDSHSSLQTSTEDIHQGVHPHHHNGNDLIFGRLFDTALHGILILDGESGRVTNVNPFLSELLGYAQHELTGKSLWDTVPFKDIDVSQADLRKLLQHDSVHFEKLPLAGKDGRQIYVEFTSVSFLAEQKKYIQCKVQDITEKARIAEKLRESEEKYRNVVDNANDGIIIVQDGMLKLVNPRATLKMEYTAEELTTRPFLDFVHPDDRDFVTKLYINEFKGANDFDVAEFRVVDKSGNISTLEIRAIIIDWEGSPALLGFLRDITEQKAALENL